MIYDVLIIGGGPAGLSAALTLGRACKRVLLCDAGPRRNAAAQQVHNFVTRDGTPPDEFRSIARKQLRNYPRVELRDLAIESIIGSKGDFRITAGKETFSARRVLLCTGMRDEMLPVEGFRELWGQAIFQCPYCHGWEVRERPWGYLARPEHMNHFLPFTLQLRAWTETVTLFTNGEFEVPEEAHAQLQAAGVRVETGPISRLVHREAQLEAIELTGQRRVPCEVLYVHPPQTQVPLISALGLTLDEQGFVQVDPMKRETSVPGILAAGDLTTRMQAAIAAAASGMQAASMLNLELTLEAHSQTD